MQNKRQISADRIVVKIGTSSLIRQNSKINLPVIKELAKVLSQLKADGKDVVLVSSGAIGVGMGVLGLDKRPIKISKQQAVAAVGQAELMQIYNEAFHEYGMSVAQMLITRDIIDYPESHTNVMNSFQELMSMDNAIPIVNENDTVTVSELDHQTKFGDNDQLAATVGALIHADLVILLSDIEGLYTNDPKIDPQAKLIDHVDRIDDQLLAMGKDHPGSSVGTGGMHAKLTAAQIAMDAGSDLVIAKFDDASIIAKILKGEKAGTYFQTQNRRAHHES